MTSTSAFYAPHFQAESVQGPVVSLSDYRGQKNVLVWFSRGFTCPFCRRYMAQLSPVYSRFQELDTEIMQVAPNLLSQARIFFKNYKLAFPFLCDPSKEIFTAYGLRDLGALQSAADTVVSFGTALAQGEFSQTVQASYTDTFAAGAQAPERLAHHALHEMQQGMFIVDRAGLIRYSRILGPLENIPGNEELLEAVRGAQT